MKLDAEWITGFVDGEGCFHIGINEHSDMKCGFQVLPEFTVVQHERDVTLLYALREFSGCGVVRTNHGDRWAYRVRGKTDLAERIVPFFEKHPLRSGKQRDFEIFRRVIHLMKAGDHLTPHGVQNVRRLAVRMNRGRSR